jgi:hypothetical protein
MGKGERDRGGQRGDKEKTGGKETERDTESQK